MPDAPAKLPRKKVNVLWWIGGLMLLLVGTFLFQLFGPNPPIIVSKQTTYITAPLGPDGLPDYEQYLHELYNEGVTRENNAAVLMWQALGRGDTDPEEWALIAAELGLDVVSPDNAVLTRRDGRAMSGRVAEFLGSAGADLDSPHDAEVEDSSESEDFGYGDGYGGYGGEYGGTPTWRDLADEAIGNAISAAWRSDQLPPLAEWVIENRAPLDLLVEASRRPRFHSPSPTFLDDEPGSLIAMLLPGVQQSREVARALATRAMRHLGEGRVDEAWQDILAIHRWARLVAQGETLVEQIVGIAIDRIACDATVALVDESDLSPEQAQQIYRDLVALPAISGVARSIDELERMSYLDSVLHLSRGPLESGLSDWGLESVAIGANAVSIDWNLVLRDGNRWYDRIVAAARQPSWAARRQAIDQFTMDLTQVSNDLRRPKNWVGSVFSSRQRGQMLANIMVNFLLPSVQAALAAEDRSRTKLELTRLAAALAIYRAEHGEYPESLEALVPNVLDSPPVDLYYANPFIYRRTDDGYLLYCAGENGVDDSGSNQMYDKFEGRNIYVAGDGDDEMHWSDLKAMIPPGADDISIRVPRPAFKLPETDLPPDDAGKQE